MAAITRFEDIVAWQEARKLTRHVYGVTGREPFARDFGMRDQIQRASVSSMSNIAEGFGRGTQGQFITFLGYCLGSLDETQSHLCAAYDREYLSREDFGELFQQGTEIRKMTISFVRSMVLPGSGAKDFKKIKSWTDEVWETYERITGKPRPEFFQKLKRNSTDGNSPEPEIEESTFPSPKKVGVSTVSRIDDPA